MEQHTMIPARAGRHRGPYGVWSFRADRRVMFGVDPQPHGRHRAEPAGRDVVSGYVTAPYDVAGAYRRLTAALNQAERAS